LPPPGHLLVLSRIDSLARHERRPRRRPNGPSDSCSASADAGSMCRGRSTAARRAFHDRRTGLNPALDRRPIRMAERPPAS